MLTPEQFKQACGTLQGIVSAQAAVSSKSSLADKSTMASLAEAQRQLNDDLLKVLVMGKFSSGKSTFLNAMMGRPLLPAKPTPTTAVIGEIVYADSPEAVLFPKKSDDKPFAIKIEDLGKHIVIDHSAASKDEAKRPNPYRKILIKYPLSVCKHGIMFVDSPGLDDPTCHDAITKDYLPTADAILYCMNSSQAFSAADKREIERLISLGYKSIIFVLTYYDVLKGNDDIMGTNEAEVARQHYTQILSKYTDLGQDGIFFVGSLPALKAKITGNEMLLQESNFPPLERKLEDILYNQKGRMKLIKALYAARKANRETGQQLTDLIDVANSDKSSLASRIAKAQADLDKAQAKASQISQQFTLSTNRLIEGAKDRGRKFFLGDIMQRIDEWTNDFQPSEEQTISMWHPKRTISAFAEGCLKHVQGQIEAEMSRWSADVLVKDYLAPELETLTKQQNSNLESFEEDLKNVRSTLSLSVDSDAIAEGENAGSGNRIFSAIAGIVAGPAGVVLGGAFGVQAIVPALVTHIAAGLVIGIISIFTPIGWAGMVVAWLMTLAVSGKFVGDNIEGKVKKKIAEKLREELVKQQDDIIGNIKSSVGDIIDKIQKGVDDNLNAPVAQCQKVLAEARKSVNEEGSTIQKRVAAYAQLRKDNTKLANDMDAFAQSLGA